EATDSSITVAFGGVEADLAATTLTQVMQTVLAVTGLALIPFITAAVVDAVLKLRLGPAEGSRVRRGAGHGVVAGLGGIGSDVVRNLHELGVDVVGIDCDVDARGVQVA